MDFRVLGPIEVRVEGQEIALGGPRQRALLALLLLHANRAVSRDALIEGLWGETPPPSAAHTLDGLVSRLRKIVGPERLVRERQGYRLVVAPAELDLTRFERRARDGAEAVGSGDLDAAGSRLDAALAEWRGEPLADLIGEPFAAAAARELEERRLAVVEQRLEIRLARGAAAELVPELEQLVRAHPFSERLVGQLALALHRAGRSADALERLGDARRRLGSELGLEPSPSLRKLERGILQHETSVEPAPRPALVPRAPPRRAATAAIVGVLAAAAAVAAFFALHHRGPTATAASQTALLAEVGSLRGLGVSEAGALTTGDGSLWLAEPSASLVLRVDPRTRAVVDRVPLAGTPDALAAGDRAVWVATTQPGGVERIDDATDTVTETIPLGVNPVALAVAGRDLWVADASDQSLIELDPSTRSALATVTLGSHPTALAVQGQTAWVVSHDDGVLTQVDLRTGAPLATTTVGAGASAVALGGGAVWVANDLAGTVTRVEPATMAVTTTLATGSGAGALAAVGGSLWVANQYARTVSRLDLRSGRIASTRSTSGAPVALAEAAGHLWTAMQPVARHRFARLVLLAQGPFTSMDPAIEYEVFPPEFHGLAYDALVTFNHTGGPAGLQIVPDLAVAVPVPSDNGLTYAVRLRAGIRYSDGRIVRAADFRRSFERLFRVQSPIAPAFTSIVGAGGCSTAACDLSRGITVDDDARTIVFHLARADPEFLFKLAYVFTAPVPPGTPMKEMRTRPFPGTGPYRIAESTSRRLRFVRNPYFHEWSRAAQPAGNPDEIVWRFGLSPEQEVAAVRNGAADWMFDNVPAEDLAALRRERSAQLHASVAPETDFVQIDTTRKPFDDVRVRRALNLALDRRRVVELYGKAARATCQVLPPGVPGFRPYCPYPHDLRRARALVRAAHATGDRVVMIGFIDDATIHRPLIHYLASVVAAIGLEPTIDWTRHAAFTDAQHAALIPQGWYADYPAASDFFGLFLSCHAAYNGGKFCDRRLDRDVRAASAAEAVDARRAATLWAAADRFAVDDAAWVPLANPTLFDFTSRRIRGYRHHLLWGFLPDQVDVR